MHIVFLVFSSWGSGIIVLCFWTISCPRSSKDSYSFTWNIAKLLMFDAKRLFLFKINPHSKHDSYQKHLPLAFVVTFPCVSSLFVTIAPPGWPDEEDFLLATENRKKSGNLVAIIYMNYFDEFYVNMIITIITNFIDNPKNGISFSFSMEKSLYYSILILTEMWIFCFKEKCIW